MANIQLLHENWLDDAVGLTASSEASDWPVENLQDQRHTLYWKSTGVASEWVKWQFDGAKDVEGIAIKYHNLTAGATVKIQANTSDSWGTPAFEEELTVQDDIIWAVWDAAESYEWWRLTIEDSGNADGYLYIGRIHPGPVWTATRNYYYKRPYRRKDPSSLRYSSGGQVSTFRKTQFQQWEYIWGRMAKANYDDLEEIYATLGIGVSFFVIEDPDETDEIYYVHFVNEELEGEPQDPLSAWIAVSFAVRKSL
jgi:hypothetical protein